MYANGNLASRYGRRVYIPAIDFVKRPNDISETKLVPHGNCRREPGIDLEYPGAVCGDSQLYIHAA